MSMYESGTITGTVNAVSITGTGTKWADAKFGISPHSVLVVMSIGSVDIYQIAKVDSNTKLTLTRKITKAFTNSRYGIITSDTVSTAAFAKQITTTLAYYQSQVDAWQTLLTSNGEVTITAPDGKCVTISLDTLAKGAAKSIANEVIQSAASELHAAVAKDAKLATEAAQLARQATEQAERAAERIKTQVEFDTPQQVRELQALSASNAAAIINLQHHLLQTEQ